jgi:hypothetical protein
MAISMPKLRDSWSSVTLSAERAQPSASAAEPSVEPSST